MTAYISTDDAATWSDGLMLDERYHLSYPDGTQTPDGTIYVVYDHGRYPGTAREILMATFTEADVVAGKPSAQSRLMVLVNRAAEPGCNLQDDRYGGIRKAGRALKSVVGWTSGGNGTNESGFTGLPGGIRGDRGDFVDGGIYGYWWSTTTVNDSYAHYHYLYCRSGKLFRYVNYFKSSGFSVRCLRD